MAAAAAAAAAVGGGGDSRGWRKGGRGKNVSGEFEMGYSRI